MTNEEKELLIKDLCVRLPYGVMCKIQTCFVFEDGTLRRGSYDKILDLETVTEINEWKETGELEKFKPYLRPMSSMTEEEQKEYVEVIVKSQDCSLENSESATTMANDWLLSKGFDVRGLISKGLAIAVTEENNPYK